MASAPSEPPIVHGRLDADGRLVAADPPLALLQREAGADVGDPVALPQIAAVAALARALGVPVERQVFAAGATRDVSARIRAIPDGAEVRIALSDWTEQPASGPRLDALVASAAQVVEGASRDEWIADGDLRIVRISDGLASRLGIGADEAVGQPMTRIFHLEENEEGALPLLNAVAARTDFEGQPARGKLPDSPPLRLAGTLRKGPDGAFAGFAGTASPAEDEGAQDWPGEIGSVLDGSLHNPLKRIVEAADRIARQAEGPLRSDYAEYAADIAGAARHLMAIVEPDASDAAAETAQVNLSRLTVEAAGMLEASAEARSIDLSVDSPGPLTALGEAKGVTQILLNLIGNAIRHSPEGTRVLVAIARDGNTACVHVRDEGPGIAAEDQERIFERFERGASQGEGTGLGLAISRRLARSMGGDIRLVSTPGEGAAFSLVLPAA